MFLSAYVYKSGCLHLQVTEIFNVTDFQTSGVENVIPESVTLESSGNLSEMQILFQPWNGKYDLLESRRELLIFQVIPLWMLG